MTVLSDFSDDERARIINTVGSVGIAAINADGIPGPAAMVKESVALMTAVEKSQEHKNDFVRSVADAFAERGDSGPKSKRVHGGQEAWEATAIAETEASIALVRGRGDQEDVDAYGELLVRVATYIADASPSREGGIFGKKVQVSAGEQAFIDRVTATVGS
jgi:hypothetical protein